MKVSDLCAELHRCANIATRFRFPLETNALPKDGIYLLFEHGEYGHGVDRIVRVGTHGATHGLVARLKEHFIKPNKDRSIFRKNIGRAILNDLRDDFIRDWEIDLTTKQAKTIYGPKIDEGKLREMEETVSNYITNNFSFIVIPIIERRARLESERKIIGTISICKECSPSANWLGLRSPKTRIRESGIWNVQQLYKTVLFEDELATVCRDLKPGTAL